MRCDKKRTLKITNKQGEWIMSINDGTNLKIGMTECGCDPGIDFSWIPALHDKDGAILITKNITDKFITHVIEENKRTPLTVHATTTGWGGTVIEPNVPPFEKQLNQIKKLINSGFPASRIVLRIDPIIPSDGGFVRVKNVLDKAISLKLIPGMRVRISVMDNYKHVIQRFKNHGIKPMYGGAWAPAKETFERLMEFLKPYGDKDIIFEACTEPKLTKVDYIKKIGCLSNTDLSNMNLPLYTKPFTSKQRTECECLPIKVQLIKNFTPCPHNCLYCYWKDNH